MRFTLVADGLQKYLAPGGICSLPATTIDLLHTHPFTTEAGEHVALKLVFPRARLSRLGPVASGTASSTPPTSTSPLRPRIRRETRRTMKRIAALFVLLCTAGLTVTAPISARREITWNREVSRIVYEHCESCPEGRHVVSADDVSRGAPYADAIKDSVLARRMPPGAR